MHRHPTSRAEGDIERIAYRPARPYALDIEIFSMRQLRGRVPAADLRRPHRLEFHQLICVTEGACTHVIDFSPIRCEPGSLLVCQPSQTEQYDVASAWNGWLVLFRPEFLFTPSPGSAAGAAPEVDMLDVLAGLPPHLRLAPSELRLLKHALAQMHADAGLDIPAPEIHALLRHQLGSLLIRLGIACRRHSAQHPVPALERARFRRFQQMLERSFRTRHQVAAYAAALGCTERTLSRTTMAAAGVTAKAFITSRILLEAKRLLVHTPLPVASIGDRLGFEDASNFVKFFKREAGCTPLEFRREHVSIGTDQPR